VCIPRYAAEAHLAKQTEKLQVLLERLGHHNKRRVMEVPKQHGINVEENKKFIMICFGKSSSAGFWDADKPDKHS
jgi:tRNA U34 2-thiouridine synthase MnmA/TrmU